MNYLLLLPSLQENNHTVEILIFLKIPRDARCIIYVYEPDKIPSTQWRSGMINKNRSHGAEAAAVAGIMIVAAKRSDNRINILLLLASSF